MGEPHQLYHARGLDLPIALLPEVHLDRGGAVAGVGCLPTASGSPRFHSTHMGMGGFIHNLLKFMHLEQNRARNTDERVAAATICSGEGRTRGSKAGSLRMSRHV